MSGTEVMCVGCEAPLEVGEAIDAATKLLDQQKQGVYLGYVYERLARSAGSLTIEAIADAEAARPPLIGGWDHQWIERAEDHPRGSEFFHGPSVYEVPVGDGVPTSQPALVAEFVRRLTRQGYAHREREGFAAVLACPSCQYEAWASGLSVRRPRIRNRDALPARVRFEVLYRDGFRCTYCGAGARDGANLHVDHIVPVSDGGSDDPENLVTACDRCNLGKGRGAVT